GHVIGGDGGRGGGGEDGVVGAGWARDGGDHQDLGIGFACDLCIQDAEGRGLGRGRERGERGHAGGGAPTQVAGGQGVGDDAGGVRARDVEAGGEEQAGELSVGGVDDLDGQV